MAWSALSLALPLHEAFHAEPEAACRACLADAGDVVHMAPLCAENCGNPLHHHHHPARSPEPCAACASALEARLSLAPVTAPASPAPALPLLRQEGPTLASASFYLSQPSRAPPQVS